MTSPLVTAQWLQQHLHDPNLVILDSSIEFQIPTESEKIGSTRSLMRSALITTKSFATLIRPCRT